MFALSIVFSAHAQFSRLLENGKSGIGINVLAEKAGAGKEFAGIGTEVGYTYKGKFDLYGMIVFDGYNEKNLGLSSDKANSKYYEVILNYWLFRKQIIPEIDVNIGLYVGHAGSNFKDYTYYDPDALNELKSFSEGMIGIVTMMNFKLTETWYFEPSMKLRYEMGSQKAFKLGETKTESFNGFTQEIGLFLFKRLDKGNAFNMGTRMFSDSYGGSNFYQFSIGYVFAL
jgi:hypothetical protein